MTDLYLESFLFGCDFPQSFGKFVDLAWEFADGRGPFRVAWLDWKEEMPEESMYHWFPSREALHHRHQDRFRREPKGKLGLSEDNERCQVQLLYSPRGFPWEGGLKTADLDGRATWLEWERYEQLDCTCLVAGGILFTVTGPEALRETALPYVQALRELFLHVVSRCKPVLAWCGEQGNTLSPATRTVRDQRIWFLNWMNVFGSPYVATYGRDFLLEAPGFEKRELADGSVLYQVTDGFAPWEAQDPSPDVVEAYFAAHPKVGRVKYRPWLNKALARGTRWRKGGEAGTGSRRPPKWASAEGLRELAEGVAVSARDNLDLNLDFSPSSLARWDEALEAFFTPETRRSAITTIDTGAYIGEVVRRNLGGRWRPAEDPLDCALVEVGGEVAEIYPMRRAAKRVEEGLESSLSAWYDAIARHVTSQGE